MATISVAQQPPPAPDANAAGGKRLALLLANSEYRGLSRPESPARSLELLAKSLQAAGFVVSTRSDFTLAQLLKEIEPEFLSALAPGDTCFLFYVGHAMQAGDDNYLLPLDFDPASDAPIDQRARSVIGLQQALDARRAGLKMVVLHPVQQDPRLLALSTGPGLTIPDAIDVQEIIYAFSSAPNTVVARPNESGVDAFTRALASAIEKPGLTAVEVFSSVQSEVGRASGQAQTPFFLPKTTLSFRFREAPVEIAQSPRAGPDKDQLRPNRVDRQEYVYIAAGTFKQGCVARDERCAPAERPQHVVKLSSGFWMGRTEVEISAYQRYVDADNKTRRLPSAPLWDKKWRLTNHPVTGVDWEAAQSYCEWAGGRLPTEAEWEYAARAGAEDEAYPLNDENSREKANFYGKKGNDRYDYTAPVRSFDSNKFGLFDMAGNVWEWVQDWFSETYYEASPAVDPQGPASGRSRVVRGGSWDSDPREHLRISFRLTYPRGGNKVGFRCVLPDTEKVRSQLY